MSEAWGKCWDMAPDPVSPAGAPPRGPGLLGALADLELEAEGLHLAQRAEEAEDLGLAGYADITLAGRLLASVGAEVSLRLVGGLEVSGVLTRAAEDWLVVAGLRTWLVPTGAISTAAGLTERSVAPRARTVLARLSLGSALRRLAEAATPCLFVLRDGTRVEGRVLRVGADFVEVAAAPTRLLPVAALAAVQELR